MKFWRFLGPHFQLFLHVWNAAFVATKMLQKNDGFWAVGRKISSKCLNIFNRFLKKWRKSLFQKIDENLWNFWLNFLKIFHYFQGFLKNGLQKALKKPIQKVETGIKAKAFCKGLFCSKSDQKSAQKVMKNHQFLMIFEDFQKFSEHGLYKAGFENFLVQNFQKMT